MIILCVNKDGFFLSVQSLCFFYFSSCLIEMAMTYSKILNRRNRNEQTILIPNLRGNGTPLRYSRLENPMDRGAW